MLDGVTRIRPAEDLHISLDISPGVATRVSRIFRIRSAMVCVIASRSRKSFCDRLTARLCAISAEYFLPGSVFRFISARINDAERPSVCANDFGVSPRLR